MARSKRTIPNYTTSEGIKKWMSMQTAKPSKPKRHTAHRIITINGRKYLIVRGYIAAVGKKR